MNLQDAIALLKSLDKHVEEINEIMVKECSLEEKMNETKRILGGEEVLNDIEKLLLDKTFLAYGLNNLTKLSNGNWRMFAEFKIMPYLFAYFAMKNSTTSPTRCIAIGEKRFNTPGGGDFLIEITPKLWGNTSYQHETVVDEWPTLPLSHETNQETFLGYHEIDVNPESFTYNTDLYETIIQSVKQKKNSSAAFLIGGDGRAEPVFIVNINSKVTLLTSPNFTHPITNNLINKYKLQHIPHKHLKVVHNGDCRFYSAAVINIISSLACEEKSIINILKKLIADPNWDLSAYYPNIANLPDIQIKNKEVLNDPMIINRIFNKMKNILANAKLTEGFFKLLNDNHIHPQSFMSSVSSISKKVPILETKKTEKTTETINKNLQETNEFEAIKTKINQAIIGQDSPEKKYSLESDSYLKWMSENARGTRGLTRFSHWHHGGSGKKRAQTLLAAVNSPDPDLGTIIDALKKVFSNSSHAEHSLREYLKKNQITEKTIHTLSRLQLSTPSKNPSV